MKSIKRILVGSVVAGCLAARLHMLHAQTSGGGSFNGNLSLIQAAAPDSIVQIVAESQGLSLLTPGEAPTPSGGSFVFWWILPSGIAVPAPCAPQNDLTVPIYQMAQNQWLVDMSGGAVPTSRSRIQAQTVGSTAVSPLETEATMIADLILRVQTAEVSRQMRMLGMDVPSFDDVGNGGTNGYYSDSFIFNPDYGTNLWIAATNLAAGYLSGVVSNTTADIQYELQFKTDLAQSDWLSVGWFTFGSEITNWTAWSVPMTSPTNLFLRVRSWQDDGSGLPLWWQAQYFGTNSADPYGNPAGDGWNNLQKFQNGMNPNVFYTPPAPQGVAVSYNSINGTAGIRWQPSPGPVTGYTVEKTDNFIPGGVQTFNVSSSLSSYQDNVSSSVPNPFDGGALDVSYRVQAHYSGGDSSWSDPMPLEQTTISANITAGPQGSAYVTTSPLPSGTTALRMTLIDEAAWFWYYLGGGDPPVNPTFDISITNPAQGQYLIPAADMVAPPDENGNGNYIWYMQTLNANGNLGAPTIVLLWSGQAAPPYFDGRAQLKQNLIFLLRSATVDSPFGYIKVDTNYGVYYNFANPRNYAFSGFYPLDEVASDPDYDESLGSFDAYWPFESNYRYRNFVFNSTNLDSNGRITTGAGGYYDGYNYVQLASGNYLICPPGLLLVSPSAFQFQATMTNGSAIPALLATNSTRWLASYALDDSFWYLWKIGVTNYAGMNAMFSNARNWFGLPILSANISGTTTLSAGNTTTANGYFYPETAQPQFQLSEYDFWDRSPIPGSSGFSITNKSDLLIAPVGGSIMVNGYAKLAVLNGYSSVYGYLGQYFTTNAYALDSGGNITTNATGFLSAYGSFFATKPGAAALVTMADIDTGQRGTSTVYCVSLNVDKNHDGNMDLTFNGVDATSQSSPMEFWLNDDGDYSGSTNDPGHDVGVISAAANSDYTDSHVGSQRDLEDFARLWICGMPPLPSAQGYTVTLSWANATGNPAINLFNAFETNGGTGYLTDTNIAAKQSEWQFTPYQPPQPKPGYSIGTVSIAGVPGHFGGSFTFPDNFFTNGAAKYLLFEGAGTNGTGELVLTILQHSNIVVQTGVWLDLHSVRDYYERAVITNNMSGSKSNWTSAVQVVQQSPVSALANDTNLIVLVHGINVTPADCLQQGDTVFKRLYWAGYQGKFGSVKWPCNLLTPLPQPLSLDCFNLSELQAYKASTALTNYLMQLRARTPGYRLNLLVHSQGNAIVSEAIKRGFTDFDTYILTQGALPDSAYDVNAPTNSDIASHDYGYNLTPEWQPMGYHGIYTNFTGRLVNFYNPQDKVLGYWVSDQTWLKPSIYFDTSSYSYDGTNSYYNPLIGFKYLVADSEESRAMVSRSRTSPIGQSGPESAHGVIQSAVDLNAQYGFNGDTTDEHSAQWTRPIQTSLPYYNQVLIQIKPLQ